MRTAIIGAGLTGLTAAHDLTRAGQTVTIYEAAPVAGGLASGFRDERWDWPLERFYHHLFMTDTAIRHLATEIGYADKLVFRHQRTAQWWRGRGYTIMGGTTGLPDTLASVLSLLRFPMLPLHDRARMGAVGAYLKYGVRDWRPLERVTAATWTRRWMGATVYDAFVHPLLEGKFGPHAGTVNMAWLWARLKARSYQLGYVSGGFQGFADALCQHVRAEGATVCFDTPVNGLEQAADGRWRLTAGEMAPVEVDRVIVTGSPMLLRRLVPELPEQYTAQLGTLKSMGAVVLTVALARSLMEDGTYWLNVPKGEFPFLAVVEHTNLVGTKPYGGDHLLYLGDYVDPDHEYFRLSHEEILRRFLPALRTINPAFDPAWVRASWLHREPYAQPIVPVGHARHIPPFATPLPGLYWASMSQVYPWDRGTNFAVAVGHRVADEVRAGRLPHPAPEERDGRMTV